MSDWVRVEQEIKEGTLICEQGRISQDWFARHVMYQGIEGTGKTKEDAVFDLLRKVASEKKLGRSLSR